MKLIQYLKKSHYIWPVVSKPHYTWSGISKLGTKINGEMAAKNKFYVKIHLIHQGITAIKIRRKLQFIREPIKELDITLFFRQLGTLINAGIPIVQACDSLEHTQTNISLKSLITTIRHEIESGKSFSQQLYQYPRYFDSFICHLIKIGEHTGKLDQSLLQSAHHKEKSIALKRQIKQALLYPAMVTSVAIAVTLIMLIFIVPRFAELFQSTHHQLPVFTRYVISISDFIRTYYWLSGILIIIAGIFTYSAHHSKRLQTIIDNFILKIPIIGVIISKVILIRFAQNLAATFSAGIPLLESLKLLETNTNNHIFNQAILRLQLEISRGLQLHTAMQLTRTFPPLMVQMIKVGEDAGKLETMLEKIAILYEQDVEHFIQNIKQLLEPLIMIILGVLIGGVVIAMYLPVFKLGTVI
jgi:type IV pilus assembly protein PilC